MTNKSSSARSARLRLALIATLLTSLMVLPAQATVMRMLEVEELTRISSDVFHGQVLSTEADWDAEHKHIYTSIRVRVDETLKGSLGRSEVVTVTQLGGVKDGKRTDYAGRPVFKPGETVVLFTKRGKNNDFIVVGLKQGKMTVDGNMVRRDFSGITLVRRSANGLQPLAAPPATAMTFDQLRSRVTSTR
ncbi:MAG: hypothetical protein J2P41_07300 [Blastocatellia bacterium]|nr:hypothetical protein [Blastocatellia bacterium]